MELLNLSCNKCGAPLEVPTGTNYATCSYCKSRLAIHTSGSAAYTEVLGEIDRKSDEILKGVAHLIARDTAPWETCEIFYERKAVTWSRMRNCFVATATDIDGPYEAGRSETFRESNETKGKFLVPRQIEEAVAQYQALVTQLRKDGWEPVTERGPFWHSARFRRRMILVDPEEAE